MPKNYMDTSEDWKNRDFESYVEELARESLPAPTSKSARLVTPAPDPATKNDEPNVPEADPEVAEFIKYKSLLGDDTKALEAARAAARERQNEVGLAQAFGDLGAGLAGQKVDPAFYNSLRDQDATAVKGAETDVERNRRLVQDFMSNKRMEDVARENREARREQNQFNNELRRDLKREKDEEKIAALQVPGFSRVGNVRQSPGEAEKARKAAGTMESLDRSFDRMQDLVKKYGSFEYGGAGGAEMETLATTLKLQIKELAELGALAGPDLGLLASQVADPSSWGSFFTRDSTRGTSLQKTREKLKEDYTTQMKKKGYAREDREPQEAKKYSWEP